jgi:hypothetical protein
MRSDFSQDIDSARTEPMTGEVARAALALISLIAIVACAGAATALAQIRSLKSEVAELHLELAPLKERITRLEQAEIARRQTAEQQLAKDESAARSGETQAAWALSAEDVNWSGSISSSAPQPAHPD